VTTTQVAKGNWARAFYRFKKNPLSLISLSIIFMVVLLGIFAPFIAPYPEDARGAVHFKEVLQPPSCKHLFGTDAAGRDVLSRVIFGTRISLMIGVVVLSIGVGIGIPLGVLAGYFGGGVATIIMRLTDVFLSIPPVVLALAVSALLTRNLQNTMFAIAFTWWPWYARLAYGETLSKKEEDFVEVSQALGASHLYIMFREILPNMTSSIIVKTTLDMGYAILTGAVLGFLGLGARPPTPEWGTLIGIGRMYLPKIWWVSTFSGLAIFITVLGFNLLGDGLRDFFDVESGHM